MFYEGLSNEDLTLLLYEKCPHSCFRVTEGNRNTAIACIEISSPDASQKNPIFELKTKLKEGS